MTKIDFYDALRAAELLQEYCIQVSEDCHKCPFEHGPECLIHAPFNFKLNFNKVQKESAEND